jgi:hypothetical protein
MPCSGFRQSTRRMRGMSIAFTFAVPHPQEHSGRGRHRPEIKTSGKTAVHAIDCRRRLPPGVPPSEPAHVARRASARSTWPAPEFQRWSTSVGASVAAALAISGTRRPKL